MHPYTVEVNKQFVGRQSELSKLREISSGNTASILIVYGRRRIGKTELIEQFFHDRNILKFEGVADKPQKMQQHIVMQQLSEYTGQKLLRDVRVDNWIDVFKYIHEYCKQGKWTVYFEELQWLANYEDDFVSELKYVWDNFFRHNNELIVVLCGSSPSFMKNRVVHSKALYNRSQHEMALREFNLIETKALLKNRSIREIMDAYLIVGGVPEYLLRLQKNSSIILSLCDQSFKKDAYFSKEAERIFISSMADDDNYKAVVEFLSKRKQATRNEILKAIKVKSGGRITRLLEDLEECGFIRRYTPFNMAEDSLVARYCVQDQYLQYYNKFIKPIRKKIDTGVYDKNPTQALKTDSLYKWMGYAFERFCRKYFYVIANMLGFGRIDYQSGAYFSRALMKSVPGYQIDLVFDRADNVITLCEIKYTKNPIGTSVITEFEKKLSLFENKEKKTIHKVLISASGVNQTVVDSAYFDDIITLEQFFDEHFWS